MIAGTQPWELEIDNRKIYENFCQNRFEKRYDPIWRRKTRWTGKIQYFAVQIEWLIWIVAYWQNWPFRAFWRALNGLICQSHHHIKNRIKNSTWKWKYHIFVNDKIALQYMAISINCARTQIECVHYIRDSLMKIQYR